MSHWIDHSTLVPKYLRLYWDIDSGTAELARRAVIGTKLGFQKMSESYVFHTIETILRARESNLGEAVCFRVLTESSGWAARCEPPWDLDDLAALVDFAYRYAKLPIGQKTLD